MKTKLSAFVITSALFTVFICAPAMAADKSKDGVSFDEYHARARTAMLKRDANGDGEFTLSEYIAAPNKLSDKRRTQLTKKFTRFDKDKNGSLNNDEFKASIKRAFDAKDKNSDGKLDASESARKRKG